MSRRAHHPPKPKSLLQFMQEHADALRKGFRAEMRVTIVVRHPTDKDAVLVVSDDDFEALTDTLQARPQELRTAPGAAS
jgi:hypothetical protein